MTEFKAGDKVRVVIEADVTSVDFDGEVFLSSSEGNLAFYPDDDAIVSAEIIEPPAPPLKRGDIVEHDVTCNRFLLTKQVDGKFEYVALDEAHEPRNLGPFDFQRWRERYVVLAENFGLEDAA